MSNKVRCLLTGATGAIGVHILKYILEKTDWEVVATDSYRPAHKGYFDRLTALVPANERLHFIQHDLCAPFTKREIEKIGAIDYIINLAARSDVQASVDDPIPFVRDNTEIMLTMLDYARKISGVYSDGSKAPLKAFLHFSTDEVYGPAPKDSKGHPEWDTILPSNPYSASKACQEALAIAWWRTYDIPVIITNTMNNFGETQSPSKFPAMIQNKLEHDEEITVHASGGEIGTRYYIHSGNTADAVVFILENVTPALHSFGQIDMPTRLNIVGDKQVSNLELVETIARLMGVTPKIKMVDYHQNNPGHDLHYGLDGTKLTELGWKSPVSFEDSLKQTIDWTLANPQWNKE